MILQYIISLCVSLELSTFGVYWLSVLCLGTVCVTDIFDLGLSFRLTAVTQLAHHGMIFVPTGYSFGAGMSDLSEPRGGSAYGSGTFAGDGSRQPTKLELGQAFHQGKYTAEITKKLKAWSRSVVWGIRRFSIHQEYGIVQEEGTTVCAW